MKGNVCSEGYASPWVCTQCGVCAAVCTTGALTMVAFPHGYRYPTVQAECCVSCGICIRSCPGPKLMPDGGHLRPIDSDGLYGPVEGFGLGWATDTGLRRAASSGGLVTALLLSLLDAGIIKGAVVTDLGGLGCTPRTRLVRSPEEIDEARGSKYMITSLTEALREVIRANEGPYAVVGMPCQIHGIRRGMKATAALRGKVALLISLFCGGTKDFRYRSLVARKMGVDEAELVHFTFRGGGWPGEMTGSDRWGRTGTLRGYDRQLGQVWTNARLTPSRCLLCDDPLAGAADLVVGDPWHIDHARDDLGKSLFLARTVAGMSAITQAERGMLQTEQSVEMADIRRAAEGILWRRFYAPSRIKVASLWARGWRVTASGIPFPPVGLAMRALRAFTLSRL